MAEGEEARRQRKSDDFAKQMAAEKEGVAVAGSSKEKTAGITGAEEWRKIERIPEQIPGGGDGTRDTIIASKKSAVKD